MFDFFKKKQKVYLNTDIHSHLLPGIDDGAKQLDDSIAMLQKLEEAGIQKVVTTPHIAQEFYPNTPEIILEKLDLVRQELKARDIQIRLDAAAEYYMDQHFLNHLKDRKKILTFGDGYLLFETPFFNKPPFFDEVIFEMLSSGYKPVFAHPERYNYVMENPDYLLKLKEKGVLLQVNAGSLIGYYSPLINKTAKWMVKNKVVDFLGSDIHHEKHLAAFVEYRENKDYQRLMELDLLNDKLMK